MIGQYLDKGFGTKDAVAHALQHCDGSWGLAVINKENPNEIVVACNGSPMVGVIMIILFLNDIFNLN